MWKQLAQFGKELFTLKGQVKKNTDELKRVRSELDKVTEIVKKLAFKVRENERETAHQIERVRDDYNNQIKRMKQDYDSQIREMKQNHDHQIEKLKLEIKGEIQQAQIDYLSQQRLLNSNNQVKSIASAELDGKNPQN